MAIKAINDLAKLDKIIISITLTTYRIHIL